MNKRSINETFRLIGKVLILLVVLVGLYILAEKYFLRIDLTDRKEFTLTPSTVAIAESLSAPVKVDVYFSEDLPSYMLGLDRQVRDMLAEVASYTNGEMEISFFDPGSDPAITKKAMKLGIPEVQLNVYEGNETRIRKSYLGIAFFSGEKQVILPVVKDTLNFEYDIASALKKLSRAKTETIAFLAGHKEHNPFTDYKTIGAELEQSYNVKFLDLDTGRKLNRDVSTLVVAGPREMISEAHLRAIDQYLMEGGKIFFLIDSYQLMEKQLKTIPVETGLDDMLRSYGISVQKNIIRDRLSASASFSTRFNTFGAPYPFWPKIIGRYVDIKHPAMTLITSFVLPWTSSLEPSPPEKVKVQILASSSPFSQLKTGTRINLEPVKKFNPHETGKTKKKAEKHPVVALLEGHFPGYYEKSVTSPKTRIVVVGSSEFLTDNILAQFPGNARFFLNLIDWMNLGEELIQIRSRTIIDRPLRDLTSQTKDWIKYANVFGVSILLILFGLIRHFFISRTRKKYEFE